MALIQKITTLIATAAIAWWLFSDTLRHIFPSQASPPLRFAHFGSYEDYQFWKEILSEFQDECPRLGIEPSACMPIQQEYIVGNQGQYNTKIRQELMSGTLPDLALIQLAPFQEIGEHFASLSTLADSSSGELDHSALAAFQIDGVQRGMPVSGGNLLIYLNKKCLRKAIELRTTPAPAISSDWSKDEFASLAHYLTCDFDGDGTTDQFGFWLPQWVYYQPFLWSAGADIVDREGRWKLIGPRAEDAMNFYRDLTAVRRACPTDAQVPQLFQDTAFITGRVAMCVNGPWFLSFLRQVEFDDFEVLPIPQWGTERVTRMTWDGVVLSPAASGNRRATAERFIRWVSGKRVQDRIADLGKALPVRSTSLDSFLRGGDAARAQFAAAMQYSRVQPKILRFPQLDRLLNQEFRQWIDPDSKRNTRDFLQHLQDTWEQQIARN